MIFVGNFPNPIGCKGFPEELQDAGDKKCPPSPLPVKIDNVDWMDPTLNQKMVLSKKIKKMSIIYFFSSNFWVVGGRYLPTSAPEGFNNYR